MNNNPVQITRNPAKTRIEPYETGATIELSGEESKLFDLLADLLEYPVAGWIGKCEECIEMNRGSSESLSGFYKEALKLNLTEIQEVYTRTFDLNPVCALEIGYHLFGEDYKRGEFLAKMRETQNPYKLGQEMQLPDYLPVVLRLLGKMEDSELRASLIGYCLLPALSKMNVPFEKGSNLYGPVIRFLTEQLKHVAEHSIVENAEEARCQYV